jgi:putative hydrolase
VEKSSIKGVTAMLRIGVDCHVHTQFSGHAYCTVRDNVIEAADRGLEGIGIADHFGAPFIGLTPANLEDSNLTFSALGHFLNMNVLPEMWHGVRIFRSVEVDIVDAQGHLFGQDHRWGGMSLCDAIFAKADYAIASVHPTGDTPAYTKADGTRLYCGALENPKVKILGHIGRAGVPFEIDEVLKTAKELGKMIEINEHSFTFPGPIYDLCRKIAIRCAELGVWIAVNSDAHCSAYVGNRPKAIAMLEEIGFPPEQIANESVERFLGVIGR